MAGGQRTKTLFDERPSQRSVYAPNRPSINSASPKPAEIPPNSEPPKSQAVAPHTEARAAQPPATTVEARPTPAERETPYSSQEAAKQLGVSETYIRKLAREGKIGHLRIGKLYKFEEQHLEEFKARNTVHPREK